MGMIGRWIDSLTDEQRDRIIEHPDPTYNGGEWWNYDRDCGCLVGCVVGEEVARTMNTAYFRVRVTEEGLRASRNEHDMRIGIRFPRLTGRFTAPRIWRVVKTRAARANRIEAPEPVTTQEG